MSPEGLLARSKGRTSPEAASPSRRVGEGQNAATSNSPSASGHHACHVSPGGRQGVIRPSLGLKNTDLETGHSQGGEKFKGVWNVSLLPRVTHPRFCRRNRVAAGPPYPGVIGNDPPGQLPGQHCPQQEEAANSTQPGWAFAPGPGPEAGLGSEGARWLGSQGASPGCGRPGAARPRARPGKAGGHMEAVACLVAGHRLLTWEDKMAAAPQA